METSVHRFMRMFGVWTAVLALMAVTDAAAQKNVDESKVPKYELPDPLTLRSGKKVKEIVISCPVPHQYPSAPEIKNLRTVHASVQRAHLPLEIPVLRRQTLPLCSVSSSSSSHSAPVRSGRCVGAEPTS